jgi:hypothetical protein
MKKQFMEIPLSAFYKSTTLNRYNKIKKAIQLS